MNDSSAGDTDRPDPDANGRVEEAIAYLKRKEGER